MVWHDERVVSIRRAIYPPSHYLNGSADELLQTFIDCIERDLSLEKWGFGKCIRLPKNNRGFAAIYDSEYCRVMFLLHGSDYGPVFASSIYYGRLHADDNEYFINWNGENCLCWHSNITGLTLPFIEGVSPLQLATDQGETVQSLGESLNVDFPSSDYIEYPLKLHAKIWERYGKELFDLFDLRKPELWEKYSKYSDEYSEALNKRFNTSHIIRKIC